MKLHLKNTILDQSFKIKIPIIATNEVYYLNPRYA